METGNELPVCHEPYALLSPAHSQEALPVCVCVCVCVVRVERDWGMRLACTHTRVYPIETGRWGIEVMRMSHDGGPTLLFCMGADKVRIMHYVMH